MKADRERKLKNHKAYREKAAKKRVSAVKLRHRQSERIKELEQEKAEREQELAQAREEAVKAREEARRQRRQEPDDSDDGNDSNDGKDDNDDNDDNDENEANPTAAIVAAIEKLEEKKKQFLLELVNDPEKLESAIYRLEKVEQYKQLMEKQKEIIQELSDQLNNDQIDVKEGATRLNRLFDSILNQDINNGLIIRELDSLSLSEELVPRAPPVVPNPAVPIPAVPNPADPLPAVPIPAVPNPAVPIPADPNPVVTMLEKFRGRMLFSTQEKNKMRKMLEQTSHPKLKKLLDGVDELDKQEQLERKMRYLIKKIEQSRTFVNKINEDDISDERKNELVGKVVDCNSTIILKRLFRDTMEICQTIDNYKVDELNNLIVLSKINTPKLINILKDTELTREDTINQIFNYLKGMEQKKYPGKKDCKAILDFIVKFALLNVTI